MSIWFTDGHYYNICCIYHVSTDIFLDTLRQPEFCSASFDSPFQKLRNQIFFEVTTTWAPGKFPTTFFWENNFVDSLLVFTKFSEKFTVQPNTHIIFRICLQNCIESYMFQKSLHCDNFPKRFFHQLHFFFGFFQSDCFSAETHLREKELFNVAWCLLRAIAEKPGNHRNL